MPSGAYGLDVTPHGRDANGTDERSEEVGGVRLRKVLAGLEIANLRHGEDGAARLVEAGFQVRAAECADVLMHAEHTACSAHTYAHAYMQGGRCAHKNRPRVVGERGDHMRAGNPDDWRGPGR